MSLCVLERSFELSPDLAIIEVKSLSCGDAEPFLSLTDSHMYPAKSTSSPTVEARASPRLPSSAANRSRGTNGCFLPVSKSFSLNVETPSDPVLFGHSKSKARRDASDGCLSSPVPSHQSRLIQSKRVGAPLLGNETKKSVPEQRPPS